MELLSSFTVYLFSQKKTDSSATVKNYLADVSRFIRWYEAYFSQSFNPKWVTNDLLEKYKTISTGNETQIEGFSKLSQRSFARHQGSLNKFFSFLKENHLIVNQPTFSTVAKQTPNAQSDFNLKEFKDFLYQGKASQQTIKNYIIDIKQFLVWVRTVILAENNQTLDETAIYGYITANLVEEYKQRLSQDAGFSAKSINRKLSSIRKYFAFLQAQGLMQKNDEYQLSEISNLNDAVITDNIITEMLSDQEKTINNQNIKASEKTKTYSKFGPIRFLQKVKNAAIFTLDFLFIGVLVKIIEETQYLLWKITGRQLFKSLINQPLNSTVANTVVDTALVAGISQGKKIIEIQEGLPKIANLKKSFYAPMAVSTAEMSFIKRIWHTLRYKRPQWYRQYHNYPLAHYINFGILIVYAGVLVIGLSHLFWKNEPFSAKAAFDGIIAGPPTDPPRLLSFSGRISDEQNLPITAKSTLRFSLYNSPVASGPALLWQEIAVVQPDDQGRFSTYLGSINDIPEQIISKNKQLFIGLTLGRTAEMRPRQQVATAGLATDTQTVHGLRPITTSGDHANVLLSLDSAGNLSVGGTNGPIFQATEGQFTLSGQTLLLSTNSGSNGNVIIEPDGLGTIDLRKSLQNTSESNFLSTAPGSVEVDDTFAIFATSSAVAALTLQQDGTAPFISASSSGTAKFSLDYLGNGFFGGDLAVDGSSLTTSQTTFNLIPTNAVNLNIGANSTAINIGPKTGNTTVRNNLVVAGNTTFGEATASASASVTFNANIASNIMPGSSGTYNLGSGSQSWNNAYLTNLFMTPNATTSGFLRRDSGNISLINNDAFLLGGTTPSSAVVKLAGASGQDSFINAGNLTIGTTTTTSDKLHVYGDIRVGTSTTDGCLKRFDGTAIAGTCSSDVRFKKDIAPIENILDKLSQLRPVTYHMRSEEFPEYGFGNGLAYGLIAQEVEQIFPHLVQTDNRGYKTVKYGPELSMLSLAGIKELALAVKETNKRLDEFESTPMTTTGDLAIVLLNDGQYRVENQQGNIVTRFGVFAKGIFAELSVGIIQAKEASFESLSVATEQMTIAGKSLRAYIEDVTNTTLADELKAQARNIAAKRVKTNLISPLSSDSEIAIELGNSQLTIRNANSATGSAVASIDNQGNATFSGTLRADRIVANSIDGLDAKLATLAATASPSGNVTNVYNYYTVASSSAQPTSSQSALALAPTSQPQPEKPDNTQPSNNKSQVSTDYMDIASMSGTFAYVPQLEKTPSFASMKTDFATVTNGLMVFGPASLAEASIADQLAIGGNMILTENSINVLGGTLELQGLRQGNISFMGGLLTIDTDGNLKHFGNATFAKNVEVRGKLAANILAPIPNQDLVIELNNSVIANSSEARPNSRDSEFQVRNSSNSAVLSVNALGDLIASGTATLGSLNIIRGVSADTSAIESVASGSAGLATITQSYTSRTIYSEFVRDDSLIYISPRSQTTTAVPYLARQTSENKQLGIKGSFTVQIPNVTSEDVLFNWWIIN